MINEVEILKELDERIEFQGIIVEHSYTGNRSGNVAYEQGRFDEIKALRDFIKTKSAHGAATPMSTDINSLTQETVYHKKSGMSEEFLINCDTKIIEAGLCLALGYNETGEKKLIEVSHMMLKKSYRQRDSNDKSYGSAYDRGTKICSRRPGRRIG